MTVTLYSPFFRTALLPKFRPRLSKTVTGRTSSAFRSPNGTKSGPHTYQSTEQNPTRRGGGSGQRQRQEKEEALDHYFDRLGCGSGVGDCRGGSDPRRH